MEPESKIKKKLPVIIALILTAAYAVYFSWFTIGRHAKTNSSRFDLGNVEQVEWNLIHGRGFTMTDPYGATTVSRLAFHADPFLAVLTPVYALFPRTETLLLFQVFVVASGGLAVFLLSRRLINEWWSVLLTLLYVVNPALQWSTIFDVHAVTFAVPLVLWVAYMAVKKKYWRTLVLVGLAMMTKEEIGLSLPLIGLYIWWKQRNAKWGIVLTVLPMIWSLLMFLVILPSTQSINVANDEVYRTVFGSGATEIISGAIRQPATFIRHLIASQNLTMAWQLLAPFGFIPIGSWYALGALPDYVINAISLKPAQHLIISHYTSGLTPWLFIGTIITLVWIKNRINQMKLMYHRRPWTLVVMVWLVAWSGYSAWAYGPLPGAKNDHTRVVRWRNEYAALVTKWERSIPSAAAVSVTNNIGSHFARRERFYSFPLGVERADYVVVLEGHSTPVVATQEEVSQKIIKLRQDSAWRILERRGELTVLKRK